MKLNKTHIREITGMLNPITRRITGTFDPHAREITGILQPYVRKINGTVNTQVSEICGDKQGNFWEKEKLHRNSMLGKLQGQ